MLWMISIGITLNVPKKQMEELQALIVKDGLKDYLMDTLGYYDRELVEKFWSGDSSDDITILLEDFSYDNQLIEQFKDVQYDYK